MEKLTALIVDQSPAILHGLESILRGSPDIQVVGTAASGVEAIDQAERLRPDVVLLDVRLRGIDAAEATRRIKKRSPESRVVFMVVHMDDIDAATEAGADGHVVKDSSHGELVQVIRRVVTPR